MTAVEGLMSKSGDLMDKLKSEMPDLDEAKKKVEDKLPGGH